MHHSYYLSSSPLSLLYEIRIFLILTGSLSLVFSILNLIVFYVPGAKISLIAFFFYNILSLFYYFLGLLWLSAQYYFFVDPIIFSVILMIISLGQLAFLYNDKFFFKHYSPIAIPFLIINLSYVPFGLVSIYFLYIIWSKLKYNNDFKTNLADKHKNNQERIVAWSKIGIMIFNYVIAYAFLSIIQALTFKNLYQKDFVLQIVILSCLVTSILAFGIFGLLFSDIKERVLIDISTFVALASFMIFLVITLFLNTFYAQIHEQITLLGPFSIFILVSVLAQLFLRKVYQEVQ